MKQKLHINGMHCKSCEMLIKDSLNKIPGCKIHSLSLKTGICEIEYNKNDISEIETTLNKIGYTIWEDNVKQPRTSDQWFEKIIRLFIAGILVFVLMKTDISSLVPTYDKLSFGVAFVIGLIASISTCLAVTGGIIIGYNESVETTHPVGTQIKFHLWRLITFIVWWWLLGLVWSQFQWSIWFNVIFSAIVGIVLLYLWLQLLGIVPNITKWWFHLPSWLSQTIFNLKNPRYASVVWALTFLLPCGFTQSMQLFALQSWSPIEGTLIMWAFALGTLPVLFGLGLWTKYIKDKLTIINPLIASLLVVFGIYTIYNSTILADAINTSNNTSGVIVNTNIATENVSWSHNGSTFSPETLVLTKWKNYSITVIPESDGLGCKYSVMLPWKWEQYIKKWQAFTFEIDWSEQKNIKLVCGSMGMKQWMIVIQ